MSSVLDSEKQRSGTGRLILLMILLGLVLVTSFVALRKFFEIKEVPLPDVIGLDLRDAIRVLHLAQLKVSTYPESVPKAGINQVTSQSPFPNSVLRPGRRVSLGVNTPREAFPVPSVVGLDLDEAKRVTIVVNMEISEVNYGFSELPIGRIISQVPKAGESLNGLEGLSLNVSRGRAQTVVSVPDLRGTTIELAVNGLKDIGFRRIETVPSLLSLGQAGLVQSQRPQAGVEVTTSTPIMLSYSLSGDQIVRIPSLQGLDLRQAELLIRGAGLVLGKVNFVDEVDEPPNILLWEPVGHTIVGSMVSLVVNRDQRGSTGNSIQLGEGIFQQGREESNDESRADRRVVPIIFDSVKLGFNQEFHLRLVVSDAGGLRTVIDRRVNGGEVVSTKVTVFGDAEIQTFIDGRFYQAWSP